MSALLNATDVLSRKLEASLLPLHDPLPGDETETPFLVEDPATGRRFLVLPIDDSNPALLTGWRQERESLQAERDHLADQVGQSFEELRCLQQLAGALSACDASTDLQTVADRLLPTLRSLVRAETIFLTLHGAGHEPEAESAPDCISGRFTIRVGSPHMSEAEVLGLVEEFGRLSSNAIIYNRDSPLKRWQLQTTARNLAAVPLVHQQMRYGWIVAIDRMVDIDGDDTGAGDLQFPEFGSREASLLSTAACMLTGHARNAELFHAQERLRVGVIESIVEALDARDPYTSGHSRRVGQFAAQIGRQLECTQEEQKRLYIGGLLHDVGKIGVPDQILRKEGKLTDEEFDVIKQHPRMGYDILLPLQPLNHVLPGVLHHHERIDGRGYPDGLAGENIPFAARILAVADSFDAMTSNRAYRSGMPASRAIEILRGGAGTQWDAGVVAAFLTVKEMESEVERDASP